jgi:hypothetical protein
MDNRISLIAIVQNTHEQAFRRKMTMKSHNTKTDSVAGFESVRGISTKDDARVIRASSIEAADLAISEDDDKGSDPYNSTGQHVIIVSKIDVQD